MASVLQRTYKRPSLIIFSETEPVQAGTLWDFGSGDTLYLTDDNRSAVQLTPQRIDSKRRMINGTMRSYHVTDKLELSTSWNNIPSRKAKTNGVTPQDYITSDRFGAGLDIKNWYDSHPGSFWVVLVYDIDPDIDDINNAAEKHNVFFNSFDYTVARRGDFNDLWDVSISLVEV